MRLLESSEKVMGWSTTWKCYKLLFHVKTIVKESHNFELAHLKKKKERKHFGHGQLSGLVLIQCLCATKSLVGCEHTQT